MDLNEFAFEFDKDLVENGVKVPFDEDAYIRIRSLTSSKAKSTAERLSRPFRNWRKVPDEVNDRYRVNLVVDGLLTEFVGFEFNGEPLEYDLTTAAGREDLRAFLSNPKMKNIVTDFIKIAGAESQFREAEDEETEKN